MVQAKVQAGAEPKDPRIVAFVAWLKRQGVTLHYKRHDGGGGDWRIVRPRGSEEYDVIFYLRSFPAHATQEQMQAALMETSLAYQLNAQARLAMSYAGFRGTHPSANSPASEEELPQVDGLPVSKAVERWFRQYKPD